MNMKLLAVVVVVVVVAAGAGAALVVLNGDKGDDKYVSKDNTGRLMLFGNADNNDYLDNGDVDKIQSIIDSGTWDKTASPLADANQDGTIDDKDLEIVKKLAKREPVDKVYYINCNEEVKSTHYPLNKIAAFPNTTLALMKSIGAESKRISFSP